MSTWTAHVIDRTPMPNGIEVAVQLSDGTRQLVQRFQTNGTLAHLRQLVRAAATQIDAQQAVDEVPVGLSVDLTPDPVITPPAPTPAQVKAQQWSDGYQQWQALQRGVAAGWIPANDTQLMNLKAQLDANWITAYRGLL